MHLISQFGGKVRSNSQFYFARTETSHYNTHTQAFFAQQFPYVLHGRKGGIKSVGRSISPVSTRLITTTANLINKDLINTGRGQVDK